MGEMIPLPFPDEECMSNEIKMPEANPKASVFKEMLTVVIAGKIDGTIPGVNVGSIPSLVEKIPSNLPDSLYLKLHEVCVKSEQESILSMMDLVVKVCNHFNTLFERSQS